MPGSYSILLLKPEGKKSRECDKCVLQRSDDKARQSILGLSVQVMLKEALPVQAKAAVDVNVMVKQVGEHVDTLPAGFASWLDADLDQDVLRGAVLSAVVSGHSQLIHVLSVIV